MSTRLSSISPAAAIALVLAIAVLCGLGGWQVKRLAWKNTLLEVLDSATDTPIDGAMLEQAADRKILFLRGTIDGTLDVARQIKIGPRTHEGVTGYHLIAPLRLADGRVALLNRGWVAEDYREAATGPADSARTFAVLARQPDRPGLFVPPNDPSEGRWFAIDLAAIARQIGHPVTPYILYARADVQETAGSTADGHDAPIPLANDWRPPNNHLQYAIFWFGMALLLAIIAFIRFRKPETEAY